MSSEAITAAEAARIFREITGRAKGAGAVRCEMNQRPHLAVWGVCLHSGDVRFKGVDRARWEYFVKTRFSYRCAKNIFEDSSEVER
jgi:hypothetical protein